MVAMNGRQYLSRSCASAVFNMSGTRSGERSCQERCDVFAVKRCDGFIEMKN